MRQGYADPAVSHARPIDAATLDALAAHTAVGVERAGVPPFPGEVEWVISGSSIIAIAGVQPAHAIAVNLSAAFDAFRANGAVGVE